MQVTNGKKCGEECNFLIEKDHESSLSLQKENRHDCVEGVENIHVLKSRRRRKTHLACDFKTQKIKVV